MHENNKEESKGEITMRYILETKDEQGIIGIQLAKWKITYSNKKIKSETITAKNKMEAINKSKDVPGAYFKIRKIKK